MYCTCTMSRGLRPSRHGCSIVPRWKLELTRGTWYSEPSWCQIATTFRVFMSCRCSEEVRTYMQESNLQPCH